MKLTIPRKVVEQTTTFGCKLTAIVVKQVGIGLWMTKKLYNHLLTIGNVGRQVVQRGITKQSISRCV
ncbi:hypothetical protein PI85_07990 [Lysinibacillus sp. A1]|uniref:hypothetical protein n=1 Tax=Lysinibacillus TaxID=400634 RepID=UPI0004D4132D|nr:MULTISPECIES: hypothetical protein [Lysinibacillus]AJK87494.1 hypothetical protein HR49_10120 [Lysinibacillus fusiformis]KAB0443887.1 hypothetical protein CH314_09775 [Lysinibacillus fusiformis]KHK53097.1 hypothetical protein PI85_07990 [Lysinibacillus sp. A1]